MVEVKEGSDEFKNISAEFQRSVGCRVTIVKIDRIQNSQLWQAYQAHRVEIIQETPSGTPVERILYHGCPINNVQSINENGFVTNLAQKNNCECLHTVCKQTQHCVNIYKHMTLYALITLK